jgi:hypothetical protein
MPPLFLQRNTVHQSRGWKGGMPPLFDCPTPLSLTSFFYDKSSNPTLSQPLTTFLNHLATTSLCLLPEAQTAPNRMH